MSGLLVSRTTGSGFLETPRPPAVVAGAGLMGCFTAVALHEHGFFPVLVEPRADVLMGSSKIPAHLYSGSMYCDLGEETVRTCF